MTRMSFITPDMSAIIDPQGSALNVNTSTSNMMLDFTNGPAPFGHLSYNPVAPNTSAGMMAGSLSSASVNNSANNLFNHHQQHQSGDFSSSFQPQDFIQQQHKTMPHIPTTEYLQQQQHQPHILNELDSGSSNPSYSLNQQSVLSASSSSSSAAAANASCEPPSSSSYLLDHAHTHHQHHHHQQLPQQPLDMYGMIIPSHGGHHLSHGMSFLPPNGHIAPAAEGESMFGGSIMVPMLHGATNSLSSADMISQSATNYIINNEIGASATTTTTTSFINAPVAGSSAALCSTTNGTYGSKISKGSSGSSKSKKSNNNNSNNNSNIGPDGQPIKPERKRKEPAKINTEIVQKQIELMLSNNVFLANKAAAAADASISVEAAVVAAMANTSTTNSSTSSINKKHNLGSHLHEMEGGGGGEGSGANDVSLEGEDVSKCPKRHRGFGASAKIFNEDGTMEVGGKSSDAAGIKE